MTKEEKNKYAYELMVKNNPEEAVKNLILKDNLQEKRKYDLCFINHLKEDKKHLQEELDFIKEDANDILYKLTINEERINKALEFCESFKKKFRYDLLKHCHLDEIMDILRGIK